MTGEESTNPVVRNAASSIFWKLVETGGSQVVSLVVQVVLARILLPEDFGAMAIMSVCINLANVFILGGFSTSLIRSESIDESDLSTVFFISLAIACCGYAVLYLCSPFIAAYCDYPGLIWPLRVLAFILFVGAFNSVQVALMTRGLALRKSFVPAIVSNVVAGSFGVWLAVSGLGVWALVWQQVIYQFLYSLLLSLRIRWRPKILFSFVKAKTHFSFGWRLLISGFIDTCYQSAYDVAIAGAFSTGQLGLYNQGKKFPALVNSLVTGSTGPVLLSMLAKSQGDRLSYKRSVRRIIASLAFVLAPIMMFLAVGAEQVICLLVSDKWIHSVPFLQISCVAFYFWPIQACCWQVFNAKGHSDLYLRLELQKKLVGIILLLFTVVVLQDIFAVAWCLVAVALLGFIFNFPMYVKEVGYSVREQIGDALPPLIYAGLAGFLASVVSSTFDGLLAKLAIKFVVLSVGYHIVYYVFHPDRRSGLIRVVKSIVTRIGFLNDESAG